LLLIKYAIVDSFYNNYFFLTNSVKVKSIVFQLPDNMTGTLICINT